MSKALKKPILDAGAFEGNEMPQLSAVPSEKEVIKLQWKEFLVLEEPEEVEPLIRYGNAPVATPFNHSLIIGKKKSRKSLYVVYMISQYTGNHENDILIADTEQGRRHVWKMQDRVYQMTQKRVKILTLRGLNPIQRREVIETALAELKIRLLVIDGIRDLLSNINDPDQCTELVVWLESLTTKYGVHIVNILHMNKTDQNARGHIGSELLNKAEVTTELELDEKAGCTIVRCESSRDIPFDSFAFTHSPDGLPELVSVPSKGELITDSEQKLRLQHVFEGEQLKRGAVIKGIREQFGKGENKAGELLAKFIRLGWIMKSGKDHSPDTIYKLMFSPVKQ